MAFVNEHIPESAYDQYDLRRVIGEENPFKKGYMFGRASWTIDREKDAFLTQVWTHRESEFNGWAFYWNGKWMFFKMRSIESKIDREKNTCWFRFQVKGLLPERLSDQREQVIKDLCEAIAASPGGTTWNFAHSSATIDFIGE